MPTVTDAPPADAAQDRRYGRVSITLHWLIAGLIVAQIAFGVWIADVMPETAAGRSAIVNLHKSVGLTILMLSLLRLGVRVGHPAPPLPVHMPTWQKVLARGTHVAFYLLMIGMPLTGWLMSSGGARPIVFFGLFDFPKIPGVADWPQDVRGSVRESHETLARITLAVLALHVAGALKHHFFDRDAVLWRMLPLVRRPRPRS